MSLAERYPTLVGAPAFRDIGGRRAGDGRVVARGRLYRGGRLDGLTAEDVELLARLGVATVLDLRRPHERRAAPGALGGWAGVAHCEIDLGGPELAAERVAPGRAAMLVTLARGRWPGGERALAPDSRARLLAWALERESVSQADCCWALLLRRGFALGRALTMLARPRALPAIVHCSAGKDRTGLVVALLLSLLGVEDADVTADYARANELVDAAQVAVACGLAPHEAPALEWEPLRPFAGVAPDAIGAVLARARVRCGSVECFLREHAQVDSATVAALRAALLVDAR